MARLALSGGGHMRVGVAWCAVRRLRHGMSSAVVLAAWGCGRSDVAEWTLRRRIVLYRDLYELLVASWRR